MGLLRFANNVHESAGVHLFKTFGTNIYEREWDVLIILDTCRIDALYSLSEEYPFLSDYSGDWILSKGGNSSEWMINTFDEKFKKEVSSTAYVSANAWAKWILEDQMSLNDHHELLFNFTNNNSLSVGDFDTVDYTWEHQPDKNMPLPEDQIGLSVLPQPKYTTARAIDIYERTQPNRMVVHYAQPHAPYRANGYCDERKLLDYEISPFTYLKQGGDRELVWDAYIDELRYGLDEVQILLNSIDASRCVITADHGEAFGEFGLYSHAAGSLHPHVRRVPWHTTQAVDQNNPERNITLKRRSADVADQLEAMGYL